MRHRSPSCVPWTTPSPHLEHSPSSSGGEAWDHRTATPGVGRGGDAQRHLGSLYCRVNTQPVLMHRPDQRQFLRPVGGPPSQGRMGHTAGLHSGRRRAPALSALCRAGPRSLPLGLRCPLLLAPLSWADTGLGQA